MSAPSLLSPEDWVANYFPGADKPTLRTVRRWIEEALVPGRVIGRRYYVDVAAWLAQGVMDAAPKPVQAGAYRR